MRSIQWLCRGFFGLVAVVGLAAVLAEISQPAGRPIPALAVVLLFGALAFYFHRKLRTGSSASAESLVQETLAYFSQVNDSRAFPPAAAGSLLEKPNEPILMAGQATLYELSTERVTTGVGTRVKLGGIPIAIGRAHGRSVTGTKPPVAGQLGLTTRALVFHSTERSLDIPLARISAVEILADGFTIAVAGRAKPVTLAVANPLLWAQLTKNVARLSISSRTLPEGEQLRAL